MKAAYISALFLLAAFTGAVQADTKTAAAVSCSLTIPIANATEDCQALRAAYRDKVGDCMSALKIDADRRAGTTSMGNSHTSRARFLLCSAEVSESLGLVSR